MSAVHLMAGRGRGVEVSYFALKPLGLDGGTGRFPSRIDLMAGRVGFLSRIDLMAGRARFLCTAVKPIFPSGGTRWFRVQAKRYLAGVAGRCGFKVG